MGEKKEISWSKAKKTGKNMLVTTVAVSVVKQGRQFVLKAKDRLIVALDVDSSEEALQIVREVGDWCGLFKVGMQLHNRVGFAITEQIQALGYPVFLDLKFHDIPNTVGKAATVVAQKGVAMFTIHASGGQAMMRKAVSGARDGVWGVPDPQARPWAEPIRGNREMPVILAVTVLTSISGAVLQDEVGMDGTVQENVVRLAKLAKQAGVTGVVASPMEIAPIRSACGRGLAIVTPGVRPTWASGDDQARVMTPREAMRIGADYLVVGRPITAAANRAEAAQRIVEEMEAGLAERE
ncbi:orotidine-5'-phosphate decarboxylase [Heliophilum fasciatum]|uniref:Orotidine 5'-phosphate decarboxylase n=1 Tax=Heliophilum fasciatum TaxID=35700 RepID=A0A4R2RVZ6_9FIRM|nr:orotidine-5'-phosphate decarboxylase [Heliophilum fasciatum]MCW2277302.1 orotidine-5'-phosphate decarboxylase [Heliophilum fasciatum]TCP67139.1 orotidine-5'-phosphate decarboxylase [Heliophilum fasciatum]